MDRYGMFWDRHAYHNSKASHKVCHNEAIHDSRARSWARFYHRDSGGWPARGREDKAHHQDDSCGSKSGYGHKDWDARKDKDREASWFRNAQEVPGGCDRSYRRLRQRWLPNREGICPYDRCLDSDGYRTIAVGCIFQGNHARIRAQVSAFHWPSWQDSIGRRIDGDHSCAWIYRCDHREEVRRPLLHIHWRSRPWRCWIDSDRARLQWPRKVDNHPNGTFASMDDRIQRSCCRWIRRLALDLYRTRGFYRSVVPQRYGFHRGRCWWHWDQRDRLENWQSMGDRTFDSDVDRMNTP